MPPQALEALGYRVATSVARPPRGSAFRSAGNGTSSSRPAMTSSIPPSSSTAFAMCSEHDERSVRWAIADLLESDPRHLGSRRRLRPRPPSTSLGCNGCIDNDEYDLPNGIAADVSPRRPQLRLDVRTSRAGTLPPRRSPPDTARWARAATSIPPARARSRPTKPPVSRRCPTSSTSTDPSGGAWAHVIGNAVPPLLGVHLGVPLLAAPCRVDQEGRPRCRHHGRLTVPATRGSDGAARHTAVPRLRRAS